MQRPNCLVALSVCLALVPSAFSQQASVSRSSLTFAPQLIGLVSPGSQPQTVTLTNVGSSNLTVSSVAASGGYKQTNNCSTLTPGESCTISVVFSPGSIGSINGAITIADNAPSSPQVVSLSGKGIAPTQLSPAAVNFGTVAQGTTSQQKSVILTAAPNSSLSINQISVSGDFGQTNNCPTSLQSGQSCTIKVVFRPSVNTQVTGALAVSTVVANANLAFSVALTGAGSGNLAPHVSAQPGTLNFGNKGPDIVDTVKNVTITNTSGNTSLTIHSVSLSGSPNAVGAFPLYKINSNTCSGMLAPGGQCQIEVAFSTTFSDLFPESYPGALTISDSDPTSPHVVGLSANQVGQLTFSPALLTFAPQPVGTTTTKTVAVTGNDLEGGLVLTIATSGDFSETGDLAPCLAQPGGQCRLTVSFTPRQTGVINGSVTIETYPECSPDPRQRGKCSDPVVLNLSGTGQ